MSANLRVLTVDEETGEVVDTGCPHVAGCEQCTTNALAYEQLQRKYQGALSEIGRLKSDPEETARAHKHWDEAKALHEWWRLATGHLRTEFDADDFYAILPRLKEGKTPIDILRTIAGITFDPNKKTQRNGNLEIYDSWALVNGSKEKAGRYEERAPGRPLDDNKWRVWLVQRIESNLKEKP